MCTCCGEWEEWFDYEGGTRADRLDERRRRAARLAHHADAQHALVCAGDSRGVFGEFPPAEL